MAVKFPLEMKDGVQVRNISELRENFDVKKVVGYFLDGKLKKWLEARWYEDEAEAVSRLDANDSLLAQRLCEIFEVEYTEERINPEEMMERNARIVKLKQYTDDEIIIANVDKVAFNQEELADLYERGIEKIYLCEGEFNIPKSKKGLKYIKIGEVVVEGLDDEGLDDEGMNMNLPYQCDAEMIGRIIKFGNNNSKSLEWLVLDSFENSFLAMLKSESVDNTNVAFPKCIYTNENQMEWRTSALRERLNNTFYNEYFSELEKNCILEYELKDSECTDKVFLLSLDELFEYRNIIINMDTPKKYGNTYCTRTTCEQLFPNVSLFSKSMDDVVTPDIKKDLVFEWFGNQKECSDYFENEWCSNPSGQPMLWKVLTTTNGKNYQFVNPVIMLKRK